MSTERSKLRGVVLAEDKRTERFFRELLKTLGFRVDKFRFQTAPHGKGAAEAWVLKRYPAEVKALRSKNYQQGLRLIAVRDGDDVGLAKRKGQMDQALQDHGLALRQRHESIALPIPTRNIETWLLALLDSSGLDEVRDFKHEFDNRHSSREQEALRSAAKKWQRIDESSLPSLRDGRVEMDRIEP